MGSPVAAFSRAYPTDVRPGSGLQVSTSGLALRIALDYSNVPVLQEAPADGQVLVQRSDGNFWRLDFGNLPTTTVADGTVTNAKFTNAPPFTLKGNATGDMAQPQDIALSVLAAAGNPIGDAIAAAASQAGSSTIVNGKPGPNITLSAADVGAAPMSGATFTGPVGSEVLRVVKGSGSTIAGDVSFDNSANALRIYETGGAFRGAYLDFNECGTQSKFWHEGNFNPANYSTDASRLRLLGFTGDGTHPRLSNRFASLAAAQLVFPSAQSLDEYLDGCCVERLIQLNSIYFGRSAIRLPACGVRFSRGVNVTGLMVSIEGAGRGVTQLILMNGNQTLFTNTGTGASQLRIANLSMNCEALSWVGTRAMDIAYVNDASGSFFTTVITDVEMYGFERPIRIENPSRGFTMTHVGITGPHNQCQQYPAVEVICSPNSTKHSAETIFTSVRTSGYRWGWDYVQQMGPNGVAGDTPQLDERRSVEAMIFNNCGSYNGWGMVRARQPYAYKNLLWAFDNCDWQGAGNALDLEKCRGVTVRGGFWIANTAAPGTDFVDPSGGLWRKYFILRSCENVLFDRVEIDVLPDFPNHSLVDTDTGCYDVILRDTIIRDYSPNVVGGFYVAGSAHNTIREEGTVWQIWAGPEDRKFYDIFANQNSQTRAKPYGTVDQTGLYTFRGKPSVTFDGNGNVTIPLPRRPVTLEANGGQPTPFFLTSVLGEAPPVVSIGTEGYVGPSRPRVLAVNQWEFAVGDGPPNTTITVPFIAIGR